MKQNYFKLLLLLVSPTFINAQNMAFDYSNKARLLQQELDEIKYPSSNKVRHLKVLRG